MKRELNEYDRQAQKFLDKHRLNIRVEWQSANCPPFCDGRHLHGDEYRITIEHYETSGRKGPQKRLTFPFWNSLHDKQDGRKPSDYNVLACISSDAFCPETFEEWCRDLGENEDSRKALATYRRCAAFTEKLRAFFSEAELQDLAEIR